MSIFTRFLCAFVGWNPNILRNCSQASYNQLYKVSSALCILMFLWSYIGYSAAETFFGVESFQTRVIIACVFAFLVWRIETIILLTVGKAPVMTTVRVCLAIFMALFGSTLIDQSIFRKDIKAEMALRNQENIQNLVKTRLTNIDSEMNRVSLEMDKLSVTIDSISRDIAAKPVIKSYTSNTQEIPTGFDTEGNPIIVKTRTSSSQTFENPLKAKLAADQALYAQYNDQLQGLRQRKLNIEADVTDEHKNDSGFLMELLATFHVVSQSWLSVGFYMVLFAILMLIETFVVTIKMGEHKCDYEMIVENQLRLRKEYIENRIRAMRRP